MALLILATAALSAPAASQAPPDPRDEGRHDLKSLWQRPFDSTADRIEREQRRRAEAREWLNDPFQHLEADAGRIVTYLEHRRTEEEPVQHEQHRILGRMDTLIERLEQRARSSAAGAAGASPANPASDSSLAEGPGGQGELRAPDGSRRDWADISPRRREEILRSRTDGFPAGYESLLEDYFRRLAAEQALPDADLPPPREEDIPPTE